MKSFCQLTPGDEGLCYVICMSSLLLPPPRPASIPVTNSSHSHHSFDMPQFPSFPNPQFPTEPKVTLSLPSLPAPSFPSCVLLHKPSLLSLYPFLVLYLLFSHCLTSSSTNPQLSVPRTHFSITSPLFLNTFSSCLLHSRAVVWDSFPLGTQLGLETHLRLSTKWWHSRAVGTMLDRKTLSELTQSVNLCSSVKLQ